MTLPRAQPRLRPRRCSTSDRRLLLRRARLPRRRLSPLPRDRRLALRPGAARRAREPGAHAGDRLRRPSAYQLAAYVIAGMMRGARRLPARQPDRVRQPRLHDLAALGRADLHGGPRRRSARCTAPILGAAAFLLLEELLSRITEHWKMIFGPLLILVVLFARGGIARLRRGGRRRWLSRCFASSGLRKAYGALVVTDDVASTSRPASCTRSSARTAPARRR